MADDSGHAFGHLFSSAVRETPDDGGDGSVRSIDREDAVSLRFGFPFPDSFPVDELLAATEAVLDAEPERALQYGGGEYAARLPGAIADLEGDRGVDCTADDVVVTNGSTHGLDVVCSTFLDPGDEVVVGAPTFVGALTLFENYGVDVTGVPLDDDGLDVDALAADLDARRDATGATPTLCYTMPTFQNPRGTTASRERRRRLLALADEYDFVVVEDDAYGDLRYAGDPVEPLKALDESGRVIRLGTFSKTVAPGVRTGWLLADEPIAEQLDRMAAGGSNTFVRSVLGYYCTECDFEATVADLRSAYARRRDHLLDCLDEHMPPGTEWTEPEGGFFVWVRLPDDIDADAMLPRAAEAGVTYLPGDLCFPDEGGTDRLRLSLSHASPAAIDRGVEALGRATRDAIGG